MSSGRKRILLALAFAQLSLVALGAASCRFTRLGWVGKALRFYSSLAGADNNYGFFAPEIGGQMEATFELIDRRGRKTTRVLESGHSHESDLRLGNILEEFGEESDNPEFRRALAASLAGSFFSREPQTVQVNVRLQEFWPISMAEYRRGIRPKWEPVYEARFVYPERRDVR